MIRKLIVAIILISTIMLVFSTIQAANSVIDPDILRQIKLVEENGEIVAEISMKSLLWLALDRSTSMGILAINEQIAKEALKAAKDLYNPVLSTGIAIQRSISPSGTNISGDVVTLFGSTSPFLTLTASDTNALTAAWSKMTTLGIAYSLTYQKATNQTNIGYVLAEGDTFGEWQAYDDPLHIDSLTAAVKIPIFQDWGDVNRLPEFRSQIVVEQSKMHSRKTKLELLYQIANIYWDMVGIQKNIEAIKASVKLSEQFVKDTRTRQQLGILDPIEVKQSESQLALTKQNLLQEIVRKNQIEDQIRAALNLENIPYGYKAVERMYIRDERPDFDQTLQEIFQTNQNLNILKAALRFNQLNLKEANNRDDSNMDLSFQYTMNGYGKGTSESTAGMSETKLHDYQVAFTWNIPFFDKITPQKIKQVYLERTRTEMQINDLKSQLKVQLQAIIKNLKLAEEGIQLANISVELVQDLLMKETEKFRAGTNTSFRVAQVQQDLINAQKTEILARIRYEKAYLSLLVLTEKIFEHYQLES